MRSFHDVGFLIIARYALQSGFARPLPNYFSSCYFAQLGLTSKNIRRQLLPLLLFRLVFLAFVSPPRLAPFRAPIPVTATFSKRNFQ